jgi:hypothetical protein
VNHVPFGIMGFDFLPWEDLQMDALLEAVVAISSGLDLPSTLRRIVAAVGLVDATYGAPPGVAGAVFLTRWKL